MEIRGLEGLTTEEINSELEKGAKFIVYGYCISCMVMTFRRSSDIFFIKSNESTIVHGLPYVMISLFLGWWGIPWGPIYTIGTIISNLCGGKDVTSEVISQANDRAS